MVNKKLPLTPDSRFYDDSGLRFKCTGCGGCCTGVPGYVWLSSEDIERLIAHLELSHEAFFETYCRKAKGRWSLKELLPHYDCIFLKNGKECSVYEARPKQCRTFPWWKENLLSKRSWEDAGRYCEGINHPDGKIYTKEEIERDLNH